MTQHLGKILLGDGLPKEGAQAADGAYAGIDRQFKDNFFFADEKKDEINEVEERQLPFAKQKKESSRAQRLAVSLGLAPEKTAMRRQAADIEVPDIKSAPASALPVIKEWMDISSKFEALKPLFKELEAKEKGLREQVGEVFKAAEAEKLRVDNLIVNYKESTSQRVAYAEAFNAALAKVNKQTRAVLEKIAQELTSPSVRRTVRITPAPGAPQPSQEKEARFVRAGLWSFLKSLLHKLVGRLKRSVDILEQALADKSGKPVESSRNFRWDVDDEVQQAEPFRHGRIIDACLSDDMSREPAWLVNWADGSSTVLAMRSMDQLTRSGELMKVSNFNDWLTYTLRRRSV